VWRAFGGQGKRDRAGRHCLPPTVPIEGGGQGRQRWRGTPTHAHLIFRLARMEASSRTSRCRMSATPRSTPPAAAAMPVRLSTTCLHRVGTSAGGSTKHCRHFCTAAAVLYVWLQKRAKTLHQVNAVTCRRTKRKYEWGSQHTQQLLEKALRFFRGKRLGRRVP
jgi:hypothetical protein